MDDEFYEYFPETGAESDRWAAHESGDGWGGSWADNLRSLWQWDSLASEIGQESQARVAFAGLTGAGKSLLFNRLRGWVISGKDDMMVVDSFELEADLRLEALGIFILADLPEQFTAQYDVRAAMGEPALVLYLLDGTSGVTATDYRWVAALRAAGKPLVVALNKCDLVDDTDAAVREASEKLGAPVIPFSAHTGENVEDRLLPALLDAAPRLAVPLGRELQGMRRHVSRRVIRQSAILAGLAGVQPVPLLDLPFQVMIQVGVVMRVGAAYGYVPTGSMNRETAGTIVGTLGVRYLVLALIKFIPFVGWAVAGALISVMTYLIGEGAIRYYEAGATIPLSQLITKPQGVLRNGRHWLKQKISRKRLVDVPMDDEEIIEVQDDSIQTGEVSE